MDQPCERQTGSERSKSVRARFVADGLAQYAYNGRGAAVHHGGAEPADGPHAKIGTAELQNEVDVFEQRETGAECKSGDGRVDCESDAVPPDEVDQVSGLQALFDERQADSGIPARSNGSRRMERAQVGDIGRAR